MALAAGHTAPGWCLNQHGTCLGTAGLLGTKRVVTALCLLLNESQALGQETVDALLADQDRLAEVLTYHIVAVRGSSHQ